MADLVVPSSGGSKYTYIRGTVSANGYNLWTLDKGIWTVYVSYPSGSGDVWIQVYDTTDGVWRAVYYKSAISNDTITIVSNGGNVRIILTNNNVSGYVFMIGVDNS